MEKITLWETVICNLPTYTLPFCWCDYFRWITIIFILLSPRWYISTFKVHCRASLYINKKHISFLWTYQSCFFFKSSEILNCLIYRLIYSQSMDPFFTLDFICFKTSSKTLKSWNNYCVSKDGSSFITRQNDRDIFESHVASICRLPQYCCQVAEKDWNIYSLSFSFSDSYMDIE